MHVTVIGGGIVGSSVAYHLASAGVETRLFDREDPGRATAAGAGVLSPPTSSGAPSEAWFRFAVDAVGYYPELVDRLDEAQPNPTGYSPCGLLKVAVDAGEVADFATTLDRIRERQQRYGEPEPGSVEELSSAAARERYPPLADVRRAFYYDGAARVDGRQFAVALQAAARARGAEFERATVEDVLIDDGAVTGVVVGRSEPNPPDGEKEVDGDGEPSDGRARHGESEERATDAVVLAGGAWSGAFEERLGVRIPVEPQRGQIVHLDVAATTDEWPIVAACRHHYLVPWSGGRVAAGATRDADANFEPHPTVAGLREVFDEVFRVAPGLAGAEPTEIRVGLRPATADGLPVLGAVPGVDGAYLATGHGATGLQLGPYSGKVVADLVRGARPEADLSPFAVDRF